MKKIIGWSVITLATLAGSYLAGHFVGGKLGDSIVEYLETK